MPKKTRQIKKIRKKPVTTYREDGTSYVEYVPEVYFETETYESMSYESGSSYDSGSSSSE